MTFDPFSRISLDEVLKHPWLAHPTADWLNLTVTLKLFEAESLLDSETVDSNKNEQENVEREESGMESCESENSSPSCSQDERVAPDSQEGRKIILMKKCYFIYILEVCTSMIKPETSVLHKPGIDVRRNAKTSLLQSKPIDFQMAPKDHRLKNKTKSGNIR